MSMRYDRKDAAEDYGYRTDSNPDPEVVAIVDQCREPHAPILEALGLNPPRMFFVLGLSGGHLARFVAETSSNPVVVIDAKAVKSSATRHKAALDDAVESTLLHEIGHAYVESCGAELDDEERIVEDFAYHIWRTGDWRAAVEDLMGACES